MRLLLDTNIVIWWLEGGARLTTQIRRAITDGEIVMVSAVTAWEIGIKTALGKLEFRGVLAEHLAKNNFAPLSITMAHAAAAGKLPRHHGDPFDRMLIAQAEAESLTLLTSDHKLKAYNVPMILA